MINASDATAYIANEVSNMLKCNKIKGVLNQSKSKDSIYLRINDQSIPLRVIIRSSNHHPSHWRFLHRKGKPWKSKNISIEFKEKYSKWKTNVRQDFKGRIKPFTIDVYEYEAYLLDKYDVRDICEAIKSFALTGEFKDPLIGTEKAATFTPMPANIKPYNGILSTNVSIDKNGNHVAADSFGADYISETNENLQYNNMRNNSKKALYESIMKDVAKIVKRKVNEEVYDFDTLDDMKKQRHETLDDPEFIKFIETCQRLGDMYEYGETNGVKYSSCIERILSCIDYLCKNHLIMLSSSTKRKFNL